MGIDMLEYGSNRESSFGRVGTVPTVQFDAGLRAFMLQVYNLMALGLGLTGVTALVVSSSPALSSLFLGSSLRMVVMLAPLGFMLVLSFGINRLQAGTARAIFIAFSVVMGISLSTIFLVYTNESIARTFFVTAGTFLGMSLYGYTTKRDLTGMGSFLVMGLFGLVIASLVGLFFQSSALQFAISVIGVLIFTGLTAWDTQRLKESYSSSAGLEASNKLAVYGALSLYLDFINLFMYLLRFMGRRE